MKLLTADQNSESSTEQVSVDVVEVIPSDQTIHKLIQRNPTRSAAQIYIARHSTPESRRVAESKCEHVAVLLGYKNANSILWAAVNFDMANKLRSDLMESRGPLGDYLAPTTMNHTLIAFRGMVRVAWLSGQISKEQYDVLSTVEPVPGVRKKIIHLPTDRDIQDLIDVCYKDVRSAGARDAAIFALAFGAGLRRSELVGLHVNHIDKRSNQVLVRGKGNKDRLLPLTAQTMDMIHTWVEDVRGEQPGHLFNRIRKGDVILDAGLTPQAIRHIFMTRCKEAGIEFVKPHTARATYASTILANGSNILVVRDLLGHSSVTTTEIYTHTNQEQMKSAVNTLNFFTNGETK